MPFKYACFISYRHGQQELTQRFVRELKQALANYIEPYMNEGVYLDEERLKGGDFYNEKLAGALCESVCLIMVFTPKYFDAQHPYCAREFKAMEKLERKRLRLLKNKEDRHRGLIMPIIFRGADELPSFITKRRLYYDFSKYTLVRPEISNNEDYVSKIEEIAQRIRRLYKDFNESNTDPCEGCDKFKLPTEKETLKWLKKVPGIQIPFPGREEGR